MAASEKVMLDLRALYKGGLAGWIPPWQYPPSRAIARMGAGIRVVRWTRKSVRSLKSGQLGFAGVMESEPK